MAKTVFQNAFSHGRQYEQDDANRAARPPFADLPPGSRLRGNETIGGLFRANRVLMTVAKARGLP